MRTRTWIFSIVAAASLGAWAAPAQDMSAELKTLTSRLESLGDRAIPLDQWREIMGQLADLGGRAEQAGDHASAVGAYVASARAWADMRRNPRQAAMILREVRHRYGNRNVPEMRSIYVTEAEMLARLGDTDGVRRLINEFKTSPIFDPEPFAYSVQEGRDTPMVVRRPFAKGTDSVTLLAMTKYLDQSKASSGAQLPDFMLSDVNGYQYSPGSMLGHVVLLDFWVAGSTPWERNLPFIKQARDKYGAQGFSILGVCQNVDESGLKAAAAERGMSWPQVPGRNARGLIMQLGIPGENASFLIDRQGRIRGRNLQGAELLDAVRRLMAEQ